MGLHQVTEMLYYRLAFVILNNVVVLVEHCCLRLPFYSICVAFPIELHHCFHPWQSRYFLFFSDFVVLFVGVQYFAIQRS